MVLRVLPTRPVEIRISLLLLADENEWEISRSSTAMGKSQEHVADVTVMLRTGRTQREDRIAEEAGVMDDGLVTKMDHSSIHPTSC